MLFARDTKNTYSMISVSTSWDFIRDIGMSVIDLLVLLLRTGHRLPARRAATVAIPGFMSVVQE